MKKAFTMIELIFVIVIIGILASIAIPKLTATRDDAKISAIISNSRTTLTDLQVYYTSRGSISWNTEKIMSTTNTLLSTACGTLADETTPISPNAFVFCNNGVVCLSFQTTVEGNLTITDGSTTTDLICEAVKADPAIRGMSNKTYVLGGSNVQRK